MNMSEAKESVSNTGTSKQSLGGQAVMKKYGSDYFSRLGKKGRKKQLAKKQT